MRSIFFILATTILFFTACSKPECPEPEKVKDAGTSSTPVQPSL